MSSYLTNSATKQGFLYIKRERTSSPVATRILFKPWQKGYFVLRQDPFLLEEYKDSSLKVQRQIHFIGIVKHVGTIQTSKSQPFVFEIVMKEKTPLLLACDNQILLKEWMTAFKHVVEVMHSCDKIHSMALQKSNFLDSYDVEVVDTNLSEANNLAGGYLLAVTLKRIFLLSLQDYIEVLSWPITHISFCVSQPKHERIVLVMGKNCHFGHGKLMFATPVYDEILEFLKSHISTENPYKKSRSSPYSSNVSSSSSSSVDSYSRSIMERDSFKNAIEEKPVFVENTSPVTSPAGVLPDKKTVESKYNNNNNSPQIIQEEGYVEANESHKCTIEYRKDDEENRNDSEQEDQTLTYLQLTEEMENTVDSTDSVAQLLQSITCGLQNPIQHGGTFLNGRRRESNQNSEKDRAELPRSDNNNIEHNDVQNCRKNSDSKASLKTPLRKNILSQSLKRTLDADLMLPPESECPELDRNTKPKGLGKKTETIDELYEDMSASNVGQNSLTIVIRHYDIELEEKSGDSDEEDVDVSLNDCLKPTHLSVGVSEAPPLPPKVLTPSKSAPLHGTSLQESRTRSSSENILSGSCSLVDLENSPPEVPPVDYIKKHLSAEHLPRATSRKKVLHGTAPTFTELSTSENARRSPEITKEHSTPKRSRKMMKNKLSQTGRSQTVPEKCAEKQDDTAARRKTLPILGEHQLGLVSLPKVLTSKTSHSYFPKSPKKFI